MPPRFSIADVLAGPEGEDFLQGFAARDYGKGMLVCSGDLDDNGVFVVTGGRLRVFLVGEDNEITLFYLGVGDIFSLHSGCLIEACEPSTVRVTDIVTFQRKMSSSPLLAYSLVSILGRAITACIGTIQNLAFHDIRQRLIGFFLDCARSGEVTQDGIEVRTSLTVEKIAQLIGSGRQATSSAISGLIREKLIVRLARGHYVIPDTARLLRAGQASRKDAGI
ncbi:MAG: Crp/Fnr family transcriptional regulator [Telmatospirillum sp.]|nr:Crp/Fnr family transcriptional regulator [Telmatospirillum sp.]